MPEKNDTRLDEPIRHGDDKESYLRIGPLVLLGFVLTWVVTFTIAYTHVITPLDIFSMTEVKASRVLYLGGIFLSQLILSAAARRGLRQSDLYTISGVASAILVISICLVALSINKTIDRRVALVAIFLCGCWQGVFHIFWLEMLVHFFNRDAYKTIYASHALGALVFVIVVLVFKDMAIYTTIVLSLFSLLCYLFALRIRPAIMPIEKTVSRKVAKQLRKSNVTLMIFGAVFGVGIYAAVINATAPAYASYSLVGCALLVGSGVLLLLELLFNKHYDLEIVTMALLPFIAIALLGLLFSNATASWIIYLVLLALLTLFDSTAFTFNLDVTNKLGLEPVTTLTHGRLFIQGGMFIAGLVFFLFTTYLDGFAQFSYAIPLILVFMLFMLVSMFGRIEFQPRSNNDSSDGTESVAKTVNVVAIIADEYDLSRRECDVLELLVSGHSIHSIAENLVVSQNTVKSHVYHIYRKMAVNSKQEVIDIRDQILEREQS